MLDDAGIVFAQDVPTQKNLKNKIAEEQICKLAQLDEKSCHILP